MTMTTDRPTEITFDQWIQGYYPYTPEMPEAVTESDEIIDAYGGIGDRLEQFQLAETMAFQMAEQLDGIEAERRGWRDELAMYGERVRWLEREATEHALERERMQQVGR